MIDLLPESYLFQMRIVLQSRKRIHNDGRNTGFLDYLQPFTGCPAGHDRASFLVGIINIPDAISHSYEARVRPHILTAAQLDKYFPLAAH